jgi:hypothetical protein
VNDTSRNVDVEEALCTGMPTRALPDVAAYFGGQFQGARRAQISSAGFSVNSFDKRHHCHFISFQD